MFRKLLLIVAVGALTTPTLAQTTETPLSTMSNEEEGEYLVDGAGMALYLFKADIQGVEGAQAKSACNDAACIGTWPPLLVDEAPAIDGKLAPSMLGTFRRDDGTVQVTYNGWPLYYYYEDGAPGDILGDDIESFGEDWYLIGPHGSRPDRNDNESGRNRDDR